MSTNDEQHLNLVLKEFLLLISMVLIMISDFTTNETFKFLTLVLILGVLIFRVCVKIGFRNKEKEILKKELKI